MRLYTVLVPRMQLLQSLEGSRILYLHASQVLLPRTASLDVVLGQADAAVSGAHCQVGSQKLVHSISNQDVAVHTGRLTTEYHGEFQNLAEGEEGWHEADYN